MKALFVASFALILLSCNNSDQPKEEPVPEPVRALVPSPTKEDSVASGLRPVLLAIETRELQTGGTIQNISISNIRYEMVSLKDFYLAKKAELEKAMAISSDKEKTQKAISYLESLDEKASAKKNVFKAIFHLNALLSTNISYNEDHTKYLKEDLSEIRVIFP